MRHRPNLCRLDGSACKHVYPVQTESVWVALGLATIEQASRQIPV
jgi:hypothetical protein